jgi:hypothetical protein
MQLPAREVETFRQRAGAPRRPDLAVRRVAKVVWRGADLAALLRASGVHTEARFVPALYSGHSNTENDYRGKPARAVTGHRLPASHARAGGVSC